jgi:hypothetical protein
MQLALRIVAAVYLIAIAAFSALYIGALRRSSGTSSAQEASAKVIPFRRGPAVSRRPSPADGPATQG